MDLRANLIKLGEIMSDYQFESEGAPEGASVGAIDWSNVEYGGFWIRFVAWILDQMILSFSTGFLFGSYLLGGGTFSNPGGGAQGEFSLLLIVIVIFYFVGFWSWKQATPGKMALGLVVVDAETGQPASPVKYVLRYLGYIVSAVVILIGYIWVAFNPRKQGWHDLIAGTVVVKKNTL